MIKYRRVQNTLSVSILNSIILYFATQSFIRKPSGVLSHSTRHHTLLSPSALHPSLLLLPLLGCAFPLDFTHDSQDSVSLLCDFVQGCIICGDG